MGKKTLKRQIDSLQRDIQSLNRKLNTARARSRPATEITELRVECDRLRASLLDAQQAAERDKLTSQRRHQADLARIHFLEAQLRTRVPATIVTQLEQELQQAKQDSQRSQQKVADCEEELLECREQFATLHDELERMARASSALKEESRKVKESLARYISAHKAEQLDYDDALYTRCVANRLHGNYPLQEEMNLAHLVVDVAYHPHVPFEHEGLARITQTPYMAVFDSACAVYVVFRGTATVDDWLHNICYSHVKDPLSVFPDGFVHGGFLQWMNRAVSECSGKLGLPLHELVYGCGLEKLIYICGHSLGAAAATLFSMQLDPKFHPLLRVINFATPACITVSKWDSIRQYNCGEFLDCISNHVCGRDVVPTLPNILYPVKKIIDPVRRLVPADRDRFAHEEFEEPRCDPSEYYEVDRDLYLIVPGNILHRVYDSSSGKLGTQTTVISNHLSGINGWTDTHCTLIAKCNAASCVSVVETVSSRIQEHVLDAHQKCWRNDTACKRRPWVRPDQDE